MNFLTRGPSKNIPTARLADNLSNSLISEKEHEAMMDVSKDIGAEADRATDSSLGSLLLVGGLIVAGGSAIAFSREVFGTIGDTSTTVTAAVLIGGSGVAAIYGLYSSIKKSTQRHSVDAEKVQAAVQAYKKIGSSQKTQTDQIKAQADVDRMVYETKGEMQQAAIKAETTEAIMNMANEQQLKNVDLLERINSVQLDDQNFAPKLKNLGTLHRDKNRIFGN